MYTLTAYQKQKAKGIQRGGNFFQSQNKPKPNGFRNTNLSKRYQDNSLRWHYYFSHVSCGTLSGYGMKSSSAFINGLLYLILLLVLLYYTMSCTPKHFKPKTSMILKIDAWERDNFERSCAIFGATVSFFTIESNPLMLQAEIKDGDKEPSLLLMYIIGRDTAAKRFEDKIING